MTASSASSRASALGGTWWRICIPRCTSEEIRLMVYLPAGAPGGDATARQALQWQNGPHRNREFQLKWEQVIREWSTRWGRQRCRLVVRRVLLAQHDVPHRRGPQLRQLRRRARAGNSDSIVAFNPGVVSRISPHAARGLHRRRDQRSQPGGNPPGGRWEDRRDPGSHPELPRQNVGHGAPRFSTEQVAKWSQSIRKQGGAITWDVPIQPNGLLAQPFLDQLTAVGKTLNP